MTSLTPALRIHAATAGPTAVIALSAVCFGLVPLFARELQALGVSSPAIALYRFAFSAALLVPFLPRERAKLRDGLTVVGAGMLVGVGWIGYLEAVKVAPVAAAGVIYMSYPLFAVLFAWLLVGQRPGRRALGAALLVLTAAALLLNPDNLSPCGIAALLWSVPAPLSFGLMVVVLSCMARRLQSMERLACGTAGASLGLSPLALAANPHDLLPASLEVWSLIAGLTLTTALIPQLLYTLACPRVGPARSAATGSFELPTMFAIGWLAFGEAIGPRELAAAVFVLAAIAFAPAVRPGTSPTRTTSARDAGLRGR